MDLYNKCFLYRMFVFLVNSIIYILTKRKIFVKAWVRIEYGKVIPNNFGDDLNIYLLELISKKKIGVCNNSLFHKIFEPRHFICIGSILGWYESNYSEIWGAGFISDNSNLNIIPKKIYSVRGKLTREKLLKMGIDCPESYGDPALLLSKYYCPKIKKLYKIGIVPHFTDYDNSIINDFINEHSDVIKIKMKGYSKWTDVIDQICSCDIILSSSLHGLIVADSYNIPNVWIKLSDNVVGGSFKFLDYFSSVDRLETEPNIIDCKDALEKLIDNIDMIKNTANINFEMLFDSCPFKK